MSYLEYRSENLVKLHNIYNPKPSDIVTSLIEIPEILRLNNISQYSGISLSKFGLFNYKYSKLDNSVGVAFILSKYIKDNKEIITGFLQNISSMTFPDSISLMKQEATQLSCYDQIVGSDGLFEFVLRNQIAINDICDSSKYSILCNKNGKLSVNVLEILLHSAYFEKLCNESEIRELYEDIVIVPNEENKPEFAFETPSLGARFLKISLEIGRKYRSYEAKITGQIVADLLDMMIRRGELLPADLYKFGDRAILEIGINSSDKQISDGWKELLNLNKVYTRFTPIDGEYCKKIDKECKYVNPLVRVKGGYARVTKYDSSLQKELEAYINSDTDLYAYVLGLDFLC